MSEEKKVQQPPPKTQAAAPAAPTGTAAELLSLLRTLPDSEKAKVRQMGIPIPQVAEGSDPAKRVYAYLCRNCGKLALHFLGDRWEMKAPDGTKELLDEVPIGVPFEQLPTTQETDDPEAIHRSLHPKRPRCMYCNHEAALGMRGGIRKGDVVVKEPWEKAMAKEKGSRRVRLRNFEREYPEVFADNTRPSDRLHASAGQPMVRAQQ